MSDKPHIDKHEQTSDQNPKILAKSWLGAKTDNPGSVSSQKSGADQLAKPGQHSDESSSAASPQDIEKTPGSTSTRELDSSEESAFGPEWGRKQFEEALKRMRPEVTAKLGQISEGTEPRADARDPTDQNLPQESKEQKILERRLSARYDLQIDYQEYLRKTRVGF